MSTTQSKLDGTGRQMCSKPNCNHKSIPGLINGAGKCPYHWAAGVWGEEWADKCYPEFKNAKPTTQPRFVEFGKDKYLIRRGPSIFTSRNGKQDCVIKKRNNATYGAHGAREDDGKLYNIVKIIACESGELLRDHEEIPADISTDFLKDQGYID